MNLLVRNLFWTAPAVLTYTVLFPVAAVTIDRRFALAFPLPAWVSFAAWPLLVVGAAIALWSASTLASQGEGTPNPMAPPVRMVARGPYRFSRNPMMLGGWAAGIGLAFILRSPVLVTLYAFVIAAGSLYIRFIEEPKLVARFGDSYRAYMRSAPRWISMCHGLSHDAENG
jgi:protein-S-isoprenylcysteine O-methyltransferase Ste14